MRQSGEHAYLVDELVVAEAAGRDRLLHLVPRFEHAAHSDEHLRSDGSEADRSALNNQRGHHRRQGREPERQQQRGRYRLAPKMIHNKATASSAPFNDAATTRIPGTF